MDGDEGGPLVLGDPARLSLAIRSNTTTGGSMLSDDEVLTLSRSSSRGIPGSGAAWGLDGETRVLSKELESSANWRGSKSKRAYEVCRKALELYSRESGIGKLLYIVNSRLRKVRSIPYPTQDCYLRAVTESCGDLADLVRLVWEGLNFEFRETMGEVVLYRGVELGEAALTSYRDSVGKVICWSIFSSFTDKREEAEEYGRAWRGGVPVVFELRVRCCVRGWRTGAIFCIRSRCCRWRR
jgi:hypothetical protein